jgi:hypothetical protein
MSKSFLVSTRILVLFALANAAPRWSRLTFCSAYRAAAARISLALLASSTAAMLASTLPTALAPALAAAALVSLAAALAAALTAVPGLPHCHCASLACLACLRTCLCSFRSASRRAQRLADYLACRRACLHSGFTCWRVGCVCLTYSRDRSTGRAKFQSLM